MAKSTVILSEPSLKDARKRSREPAKIVREDLILPERLISYCNGKKCFIRTYGCQANVVDSQTILGILEELGYLPSDRPEDSDFILLNTCAVRENAEDKVFGEVGSLKKIKDKNPSAVIALCGCMIQQPHVVEKLKKSYPQVDLMFGTHNIHRLPLLLEDVIFNRRRMIEIFSREGEVIEHLPIAREDKIKAFVNIQFGCDKFCTYCIVPYTRGKQRSRTREDILKECRSLVYQGYKEITLLGQNVNAYGKDIYEEYGFADLLKEVAETRISRLRFMTSHPWDFTQAMFDAISAYPNIMPYIHLPLQSGSDSVLRRMGRRYTSESYRKLVDDLRRTIPGVALSTDIIVGFPNETDEEFEDTMKMVEYCRYDSAFTFIYSPRIGTPAAAVKDDVSDEVKHRRFNRLIQRINEIGTEKYREWVGKTVTVLVEGSSKKDETVLTGYTEDMKLVNFRGDKDHIGRFVSVKITGAHLFYLSGEEADG